MSEGGVKSGGREWSIYPARFLKERELTVRESSKRGRGSGRRVSIYPASFQKKSGLGVDTGKEMDEQYAREGCIRCVVRGRSDRTNLNRKKESGHMKVREVLDRIQCEEPKTSYAAGIKAYVDQMLRNYSGGAGR